MEDSEERLESGGRPHRFNKAVLRGWLIVCGIAVAFVFYGLLAFFVIGDKEQPDWDFGTIEDTPGESVYSTYPYRGRTEAPDPQHVDRRPPEAEPGISETPRQER